MVDRSGASVVSSELLDVVDARLPGWRAHRPRRTLAAAWPTGPVPVGGREIELFSLPGVGVSWFSRGRRYWWRRVSRGVLLLVGASVQVALDVGVAVAADGARPVVVAVLAVLSAAAVGLYWRPDLLAARRSGVSSPLPVWLRWVGAVLGTLGAALTPLYVLGMLLDLLPRFPVQERVAWDFAVGQLATDA